MCLYFFLIFFSFVPGYQSYLFQDSSSSFSLALSSSMYFSWLRHNLHSILRTDLDKTSPSLGKTGSGTIINKLCARKHLLGSQLIITFSLSIESPWSLSVGQQWLIDLSLSYWKNGRTNLHINSALSLNVWRKFYYIFYLFIYRSIYLSIH